MRENPGCAGCLGPADPAGLPGVGRREFVGAGLLAAASLLLASCGVSDATGPDLAGGFQVDVARYPALASDGGIALVTGPSGFPAAVVRTGGSYLALSRVCPHQGRTVNLSGAGFRCPEHGATFRADGTWTGGQRTSSMRRLATRYDAATGTLTIG